MDKVLFGLGVTALGMIVVFAGLTILIGFIVLLGKLTREKAGGNEKKKPEPPVTLSPAPVAEEAAADPDTVPPEVVAAITAAIACVWEGNTGFRVCRVKRIHNAPAWNMAGREEQSYSHI